MRESGDSRVGECDNLEGRDIPLCLIKILVKTVEKTGRLGMDVTRLGICEVWVVRKTYEVGRSTST